MSAAFGSQPTFEKTDAYGLSVNPDGQVFTLRFNDLSAIVEPDEAPLPIAIRTFSIVLPISDGSNSSGSNSGGAAFRLAGYSENFAGTNGFALLCVNGVTTVLNFPPGEDETDFVMQVDLDAAPISECRISVVIQVERDAADVSGKVTATTLEGEILAA